MNGAFIDDGTVHLTKSLPYRSGSFVNLPIDFLLSNPGAITFEMWVDSSTQGGNSYNPLMMVGRGTTDNIIHIWRSVGGFGLMCLTVSGKAQCHPSRRFNNVRYHLALVYNPLDGYSALYFDGELVVSVIHLPCFWTSDFSFFVGATQWQPHNSFLGSVDEVRVWAGAFTKSEAFSHYQIGEKDLDERKRDHSSLPSS